MKASKRIATEINNLVRKEIPKAIKAQQRRILNLLKSEDMIPKSLNKKKLALDVRNRRVYLDTDRGIMQCLEKVSLTTPFVQMLNFDFRHGLDNLSPDSAGTLKLLMFLEEMNKENITDYSVTVMNF